MNVPILQAEYQTKKEQLFLQKTNAIAKKSYKIDSDLEFKIFCREYRIEQYMKKE